METYYIKLTAVGGTLILAMKLFTTGAIMAWTVLGAILVIYLMARVFLMDTSKPIEKSILDHSLDKLFLKVRSKFPWR